MKLHRIALLVAALAALLLVVAGPGTRLGLWEFRFGFLLMRWALFAGIAAAGFAVLLLAIRKTRTGNVSVLIAAVVVGLVTAWVPWDGYRTARSLPRIHDISTDTGNPPRFVDVVPLRADAPNPPEYPGAEVAEQQHAAYPDIEPLQLDRSPADVLRIGQRVLEDMGMEIVSVASEAGRIEATATTFWFGFKDDVVVRVVPLGNGSRLDVRSKSRVGRSDVGANAARIRRFIAAMREQA